jgi:hypothetical protein
MMLHSCVLVFIILMPMPQDRMFIPIKPLTTVPEQFRAPVDALKSWLQGTISVDVA